MQHANLDGLRIGYHVAGERGDNVLLIMGFTMAGRVWVHQWPTLAETCQVAFFDNRGVGASDRPRGLYTMQQMARDTIGLLDHLGWQRAHVVGVSMGGMIAQHVALAAPERVNTLSLIATTAGGPTAALPTRSGLINFLKAQAGDRTKRLKALEKLLFPQPFRDSCDEGWMADVMAHDFLVEPAPLATRKSQLAAVFRHDVRKMLPKSAALQAIPTLIVRPGLDELVTPRESDRLAALLPHADVLRLDDAGHGAIRQCKDRVNDALLKHFAQAG